MSMDLFRKIVDESIDVNVSKFVIHGLGEPLLDRHLDERIRYVHEKLYGVPVEIYTNGQFLTPKRFQELKDAGISGIVVSLNAVRAEQHESIMSLNCFEQICANLDTILSRPEDHIGISIHACQDGKMFTAKDNIEFRKRWGDRARVIVMGNWAGDKDTVRPFDPNSYCYRSDRTVYITYDGKLTMCCFDPTGLTVFGDLNEETLKDVYDSVSYRRFRLAHKENRAAEYEQCRGCSRI